MNKQFVMIAGVSLLLLSACGGGGGDDSAPPAPDPITKSDILTIGPIDGFGKSGSLRVNGTDFSAGSAMVTIDDKPAVLLDLSVGQIVRIKGKIDDDHLRGTAEEIEDDDPLEGPIETGSIDLGAGTFRVLGTTVITNIHTVYDDVASLAALNDGDLVEVSGSFDADDSVLATRIELKSFLDEFEVHGTISNLDTALLRFNLNDLEVGYSGALLDDFPSSGPANGDRVEVKGSQFDADDRLLATKVELKDDFEDMDDDDEAEIEGLITRFASAQDFDVAGLPVTANMQTIYEHGTASDLAENVRVEVEGPISDGRIVAHKIEFEDFDDDEMVEIEATVDSVNVANGVVVLLGISVQANASTEMEDKSDLDVKPFGLEDIEDGDFLEVRGFVDESGQVIATRIERDDVEAEVVLQGLIESINDPNLAILGVTVQTNSQTEFEDVNDTPISAADFFNAAGVGTLVKVKGFWTGGAIVADEAELED